jgi:hypothetical protein
MLRHRSSCSPRATARPSPLRTRQTSERTVDGVVLTSTVTRSSRRFSHSAADANVGKIAEPVLFIHNTNDGCSVSPIGGIAPLMARLPKGADVTHIDVTSPVTGNDPCEPFSAHGYMGIEDDVTGKILAWMRAYGAQGAR